MAVLSICSLALGLSACGHKHTYEEQVVAPICTEQGYTLHTCSGCGDSYKDSEVEALGHSFTDYVSNGDATCTTDGTKTAVCDHSGCGKINTITDEGSKLGHSYGEPVWTWTVYESATATFTCANDSTHVESRTATGEAVTSAITTPATDNTDGVKTYTATVTFGGKTYTDEKNQIIIEDGHTWSDNVCIGCGYDAGGSKGLNMVLNSDTDTYSLNGIGTCTDTEIIIPSTYNGLPVTAIGNDAFKHNTAIVGVTIPDSVSMIGDYAFGFCTAIERVTFGENSKLTSIGEFAFQRCTSLMRITIPAYVTSIEDSAFGECSSIKNVTFEENSRLKSIGELSFWNCAALVSVTIPSSVVSINHSAFLNSNALTTVYYGGMSSLNWESAIYATNNERYDKLTEATIYYYSENLPSIIGNFWRYENGAVAVWQYTKVSFNLNADSKSDTIEDKEIYCSASLELPELERLGYTFKGWSDGTQTLSAQRSGKIRTRR